VLGVELVDVLLVVPVLAVVLDAGLSDLVLSELLVLDDAPLLPPDLDDE
jgi:hypothetical protein